MLAAYAPASLNVIREYADVACRHAFHAPCWEQFQRHHDSGHAHLRLDCPNGRGSESLAAFWRYVGTPPEQLTQVVNGVAVPNELHSAAEVRNIHTPPASPRANGATHAPPGQHQMQQPPISTQTANTWFGNQATAQTTSFDARGASSLN